MLQAVERALPADVAIFAAAVADWRVANAGEQKIKKKAGQTTPELVARRKSRHPLHHRASQIAAAETGDRLCRRDRERRRQCQGQTRAQGLRLDSRQRRVAGKPASWAATATPSSWCTPAGIEPWPPQIEGRRGRDADRAHRRRTIDGARSVSRASTSASCGCRTAHDLPLPSYQSALAAGLDLHGRGAGGRAADHRARRTRAGADRHRDRAAGGHRGAGAAALRPRRHVTASRCSMRPAPSMPTTAAKYRFCLSISAANRSSITRGMRIAQLVIAPVIHAQLREVASLDETSRGTGGFGSTGG